jgi:hypothetical protein
LIAALGRVLALDVAVVIPGHGPPTTLAEVARFREMLVELRTAVDSTIKAGASEAAAMQEVTLPQYAHVQRYKEWMPLDVRAAYRYIDLPCVKSDTGLARIASAGNAFRFKTQVIRQVLQWAIRPNRDSNAQRDGDGTTTTTDQATPCISPSVNSCAAPMSFCRFSAMAVARNRG